MIATIIVAVFIFGYACIALEHGTKINKAPVALLMCAICWTLYTIGVSAGMFTPHHGDTVSATMLHHLSETCEIIVFLMISSKLFYLHTMKQLVEQIKVLCLKCTYL